MILDFGLVTDAAATAGRGVGFGTPGYMSPEQRVGLPVSPASDWYSVGVILYQALTGQPARSPGLCPPLEREIAGTVEPSSIAALRPNAPSDLCDLAAALLQPNPLLRPMASQVLRSLGMSADESNRTAWFEPSPFVGRENEIAALHAALGDSDRGRTTTIFIHGPSGVGKSAFRAIS